MAKLALASKTVGADAAVRPLLFTPPRCGDPADAPADPARRAGDPGASGALRFMLADRRADRRFAEAVCNRDFRSAFGFYSGSVRDVL